MKSINVMRKIALLILVMSLKVSLFAQLNVNSPYTYFGLGERGSLDHGAFGALGNNNISVFDSTTLNYYNPATYNTLSKGKPLFSFGISSRLSTLSEGDSSHFSEIGGLQHFVMAFPIKKYFGFALGIRPYSSRGYSIFSSEVVGADTVNYEYSGGGGSHEVFGGISTDLIHLKNTRLGIGANFGYLFGALTNVRKSYLADQLLPIAGGIETKRLQLNSFHYEFGMYFSQTLYGKGNKKHTINLSATYEPYQNFSAKYSENLLYALNVNNISDPATYDTVSFISDSIGKISSVPTLSVGLNYTWDFLRKNGEHNAQLAFNLGYTLMDWSKFTNEFNSTEYNYLNSSRLNFGIQYTPETDFSSGKANTKFHSKIRYRAGLYHYTLPYVTNSIQVTDFGTTFGVGLPITVGKAISSVNIGFAIGERGVADSQLLRENYYGINLGVTISPSKADTWFRKRKLN